MTPNLRIEILGTPVIKNGKTVVNLNRRLLRVLLFYMAARGEPVSRGELVTLLWPFEEDESQGRRALTQTISRLRSTLGADDLFIVQGDMLSLNEAVAAADVKIYRRLLESMGRVPWQIPASHPLPADIYTVLKQAASLWHGNLLLEGLEPENDDLDAWLTTTRQQYEVEYHNLLLRLADHETASGKLSEALNWLLTILRVDITNDDLHARALQLMLDLGRRKDALGYCQQLAVTYQRELGAPLPPFLAKLQAKAVETAPENDEIAPGPWKNPRFNVPFTGRQEELLQMQRDFYRGGILLLRGEAGAGKTCLVQNFYPLMPQQSHFLLADCRSMQSTLPFQPIIDMLRFHVSAQSWRSLPQVCLGPITSLLPELQTLGGKTEPAALAFSSSLFDALHQALTHLFRSGRVLLLLDNAQWADEATLSFISYLVEKGYFQRALLVVSYQPETPAPFLEPFIAFCLQQPGISQLDLPPLSAKETASLAHAMTDRLPSILVEQLYRNCGGNPFFILETLHSWMQMNPAQLDQNSSSLPVPVSIHALFRERTRMLSANALQVLETAAVVGSYCPLTILEKACHLFIEQVVKALDELHHANLLQPQQQSGGSGYVFTHDQFRELLLQGLSPARRRMLHLRAANAIQAEYSEGAGNLSSLVAQHYQEAGEPVLAFDWWLRAAAYARQLFALAEAGRAYEQAEAIFESAEGRFSDEHVERLYTAWGQMSVESENQAVLGRICAAFLKVGQRRKKLRLTGLANSLYAAHALLCGDSENGLQHIQIALNDLGRVWHIPGLIEAHNRQAALLTLLNRFGEAVQAYETALTFGADSLDPQMLNLRFTAHYKAALIFILTGWPVKAEALIARGQADLGSSISPYNQSRLLLLTAMTRHYSLNFEASLAAAQQSRHLARELQNPHQELQSLTMIIRSTFALGRLVEAWQLLTGAIEACQKNHFSDILAQLYNLQGEIQQTLLDFPAAALSYQKSLEDQKIAFNTFSVLGRLGYMEGLSGHLETGLALIDKAIAGAKQVGTESMVLHARFYRASLLLPHQDVRPELTAVIEEAERRGYADTAIKTRFHLLQRSLDLDPQVDHHIEARAVKERIWQSKSPWLQVEYLAWMARASQHRHLGPEKEELRSLLQQLSPDTADKHLQALFKNYCQQMLR
ncbi:MAG TPA: AAA family ATPase [Anaerolineaceae bacterium]|nr:AAA family ATPase [Anaerolineaceae bacterium]HPN51489.1 AAA family ATPase [Anaerolineaceae bacterium]